MHSPAPCERRIATKGGQWAVSAAIADTRRGETNRCSDLKNMSLFTRGFVCGSPLVQPCFDFGRCATTSGIYVYDANCCELLLKGNRPMGAVGWLMENLCSLWSFGIGWLGCSDDRVRGSPPYLTVFPPSSPRTAVVHVDRCIPYSRIPAFCVVVAAFHAPYGPARLFAQAYNISCRVRAVHTCRR